MQLMRQDMEIRRYIFSLLLQFVHSVPNFAGKIIMLSSKLVESDCQECESLVDVVVKLSGYTGAFLLLCFNQLFGHAGECLFHLLAASNDGGEPLSNGQACLEKSHSGNALISALFRVSNQNTIGH